MLAAVGGKLDGDMDGIDLMPFVTGEAAPPKRTLHWRLNRSWAVRDGEWKLVFDGAGVPHLFRIVDDIAETHDVGDQHPDVLQRLKVAHDGWNATLMPKLWGWDKSFPIYDGPK